MHHSDSNFHYHVEISRGAYSKISLFAEWCREAFGPLYWEGTKDTAIWTYSQIFGYTSFSFLHELDAQLFWEACAPLCGDQNHDDEGEVIMTPVVFRDYAAERAAYAADFDVWHKPAAADDDNDVLV